MRILALSIYYWPEQTGIAAVMTRRCEYLASLGHDVVVCTGMPHYPEWQIRPEYRGKAFLSEKCNGVTILRSWLWVPKKVTSAGRVLMEASFLAGSLLRAARNSKPDLLLVVSPPLGLGISAVLLSRWLGVPYVFDVQDLQPDAAAELGMLPRPLLPVLYRVESSAYRNASLLCTVTEGMRQRMCAKGPLAADVVVVPPPAEDAMFNISLEDTGEAFRSRHNLHGKFIVAHSGNMGVKQGLDQVIDAAAQLKAQQDIVFVVAGDGAMKASLKDRAARLELTNIRFLPVQEQSHFIEMLAAIDMALIVQQASVSDIVFPSKTVTLLSAGLPIAAAVSATSEIARVIRDSGGGIVTPPQDVDSLAQTIGELFRDREKGRLMGQLGRQYAFQHWNQDRVLRNFESHLMSVLEQPVTKLSPTLSD